MTRRVMEKVGGLPILVLAGLSAALVACGTSENEHCLALPCPLPMAITITVTPGGAVGAVDAAFVKVSGAAMSTVSCSAGPVTTCFVPGVAGTYLLEVGAPGFESAQRTAVVQGTTPECGCPTVTMEHLDVALVAIP